MIVVVQPSPTSTRRAIAAGSVSQPPRPRTWDGTLASLSIMRGRRRGDGSIPWLRRGRLDVARLKKTQNGRPIRAPVSSLLRCSHAPAGGGTGHAIQGRVCTGNRRQGSFGAASITTIIFALPGQSSDGLGISKSAGLIGWWGLAVESSLLIHAWLGSLDPCGVQRHAAAKRSKKSDPPAWWGNPSL